MPHQVILLHQQAPPKPAEGRPCNGCGVCCTVAPCPLGQWLTKRRTGACRALRWDALATRYQCGVVQAPGDYLPWLPASWARGVALRWIAAAKGCDSDYVSVV